MYLDVRKDEWYSVIMDQVLTLVSRSAGTGSSTTPSRCSSRTHVLGRQEGRVVQRYSGPGTYGD